MAPVDICPRCGQSIQPQVRYCLACGLDLAFAAILLTEQAADSSTLPTASGPIAPEILVPRLGDILLEKKLISPEDLQRALETHRQDTANHQPRLLGKILLEENLIDQETLDQVITEQIFLLQAALQRSNAQLEQRIQERTRDLQLALSRLSELNQLKSNFLSNISHELRTPLTHIKGYLDLFAAGTLGDLTPEQENALGVLLKSEARLESLIEDLIRFSMASKGEFTLHKEPFDVPPLVRTCVERIQKKLADRQQQLEIALAPGLPQVHGDNEKITWALLQLLDNAVKFTPKGGKITVCAELVDQGVRVRVADTGIGIPAERIEEIFEPFHQLDESSSRRYGGTGLGLALVKRILEAHGSLIEVRSEVGKGSSFEYVLPKVNDEFI